MHYYSKGKWKRRLLKCFYGLTTNDWKTINAFFQVVILVAELLFDCIACCANKKSSPRKQAISASKLMLR